MAGSHLPTKRRPPTTTAITATTPENTHLALLRPDTTFSLYLLPSLSPLPTSPFPTSSAPHALLLPSPNFPLLSTKSGSIHHPTQPPLSLPGAPALLAHTPTTILAAGGTARELLVLSKPNLSLLARHPLSTNHRHPLTALAASPDATTALVCSQAVTLVDLSSGKLLRRYTGHSTPVSAAISLPTANRFITATTDDVFISIWDADMSSDPSSSSSAKRRRKSALAPAPHPAVQTLVSPEPGVTALSVDPHETSGVSVAATLASGAVAVWRNWTEKGACSPTPCSFVVRGVETGVSVFAAAFPSVGTMCVVYGSVLRPQKFVVALGEVEGGLVQLPDVEKEMLVKARRAAAGERGMLVKGAARVAASAVGAMPGVVNDKRKAYGDVGSGDEEEEDQVNALSDEDGEPTIEQKLMALGVSKDDSGIPGFKDFPALPENSTVVGSRVSVITQAVRSRDVNLFDKSIERVKGKALIRGTIERLPPELAAGAFLDMLVERLQKFPTRAEFLVQWIREVLLEHAGALISQQRNKALVALVSIVTERTRALEGLSQLEGRLELVVGQAERLKRAGRVMRTGDAVPVAEYIEEEGSGSDEDDTDESGSSEEESEESGSEDDEEETNDLEESSSSEESESDEEMEDAARGNGETAKGAGSVKMNGNRVGNGQSSGSADSSDEGT